jgi:hypothetical protein
MALARTVLFACDALVAWCMSDGGALAMARALARLAAMAAATLLFFGPVSVGATVTATSVLCASVESTGQAFSTALRVTVSIAANMTVARAGQIVLNDQNVARPVSRTPGFWSDKLFFVSCSIVSAWPEDSHAVRERAPWTSMYVLTCDIP